MKLASLVRQMVDQRLRPGQRGGTTVRSSLPEAGLSRGTRTSFLNGWDATTGQAVERGRYGRGGYGRTRYGQGGW